MSSSADYVALSGRFASGWPWPQDSWGLTPMFGADGWCESCGVPSHPQTGSLVIQANKFPTSSFWMPNWRYDTLCVRVPDASHIIDRFDLTTRPVRTPRSGDTDVVQLLPQVMTRPWFDETLLRERVRARHDDDGARCPQCGVWRWLPLASKHLPAVEPALDRSDGALVASCEWFGDGKQAFRELRLCRPLALALVSLNPRVWSIEDRLPEHRVGTDVPSWRSESAW